MEITLKVNGHDYTRSIESNTTLLDFLRNEVRLTGTKKGCDVGECGCCTVLIDDDPSLACIILAKEAEGSSITTIEGISDRMETSGNIHPVQQAMVEEGAIQCGFCTPAMVVNGVALIEQNLKEGRNSLSQTEIKECVSGTMCRCTGYVKIEKAIAKAAKDCSCKVDF